MRLLCELNDKMLGLGEAESFEKNYKLRKAARAVILNEKGQIAYQFLTRPHLHKLPGGGVDAGETIEEGLRREVREEVGYTNRISSKRATSLFCARRRRCLSACLRCD